MPSVSENKNFWSQYDWSREGQEWSYAWGGSRFFWVRTVLPRILKFVPTGHILEIGCGHGRFTRYLAELCEHLTGVDIAEPCVSFCREKFPTGRFFLSDGQSLPECKPVDFAFSFDSLVHSEMDALEGYLCALAIRLSADGVAFIHHSNMASVGEVEPVHMRGRTVSALGFRQLCHDAKLKCISQETLVWGWQGVMSDCISVVVRPGGKFDHPFTFRENAEFMSEVYASKEIADFYFFTDPEKYDE